MSGLLRKAIRDVTKRRLRSLLTLLGVMTGVAGIVAIISTGQNLAQAQANAYSNASQADITMWVWDAPSSTTRAVESIDHVSAAELRADVFTRCQWGSGASGSAESAIESGRDVSLHGAVDLASSRVNQVLLRAGRFPREGEFVLEQSALAVAPLELGNAITCRGTSGNLPETLTLVGIVQTPNYPSAAILDLLTIYTTSADAKRLLGTAGSNSLLVKLDDPSAAPDSVAELTRLLDRRAISHGSPDLRDPQNFPGKRELDALFLLLSVFSLIGLAASGFLVANTLAAIAAEQAGEIGTVKAIGGTRSQVLTIYIFTALLYGLAGTLLGLALGAVASWQLLAYIGSLLNLTTGYGLSPVGILLGIIVGLAVPLVAGILPSLSAARIPVKEALEAYGITSTYGLGRVDRFLKKIVALPPLAAMSLRNLARRKGRTLVTVLVIAVAVATLFSAQSVNVSVNAAIDGLFRTYRADAWVWFGEYVSAAFEGNLRALPSVRAVEAWSLDDAWVSSAISSGLVAARARLWGLPVDTALYAPNLVAGRWFRGDETDAVVISSDLAQSQKLGLGDWMRVDTGGDTHWFKVVGVAVDNSVFLGSQVAGKVFMREDIVARMQHREGYATFFALAFNSNGASVESQLDGISERFKSYQIGSDSAVREVSGAKQQTGVLSMTLEAMSLLVGLIGTLGIANTLTMNVLERRRELGVLRALGASDLNLVEVLLTEGLALGISGWLVGLLIGYPLGLLLTRTMETVLFQIDYIVSIQMALVSLVFAMFLATAASLVPALAAARLKVGQVLRYE